MRKVEVRQIIGNEILAKDIYSNNFILMTAGVRVKKEYVSRLEQLNITSLYVEDDHELPDSVEKDGIIELQIKDHCKETIKNTIEKFTYCGHVEVDELKNTAEEIILDLLEQPEIMFSISGVREKSESIYLHSINVCTLSVYIALKIGMSKEKVQEIAMGSILHDVGLTALPFDYLRKSIEDFSEKELQEYRKHTVYGYTEVENGTWLSPIAKDIILYHHERLDGTGYPFHLKEEKIKMACRIVSICDEFDRLVYGNFKQVRKVNEAIEYIVSQAGIKFDFDIVKIFNECIAAYPNGTKVVTTEDEIGVVIRQNLKCPTRPVIGIIKDNNERVYDPWIEKDLTKELSLFIKDVIE